MPPRKKTLVTLSLIAIFLVGVVAGEISLIFWASRAGVDTKLVAFMRLEEGASRDLPLVVRCDDSHGSTYFTFYGDMSEELLKKIAPPRSDEFSHQEGFEDVAALLRSTNAHISVFQKVQCMGMDLGSWHEQYANGSRSTIGAMTYGASRTFAVFSRTNASGFKESEWTRGPYDGLGDHTVLLRPTLARVGWDLAHTITLAIVAACLYSIVNLRSRK